MKEDIKYMKKIILFLIILVILGFVGCGQQTANKNAVLSEQDVQGFWYDDSSGLLMGFKGEAYILYGFGTQFSVTGTFEVDGQTLIVYPEGMEEKKYTPATIEDGVLSLETTDGQITRWRNVSEEEVERMMLEDE